MSFISIPTSRVGFLPEVLDSLKNNIEISMEDNSVKQQLVASAIASLFTLFASAVDAAIHAVCFVIKTPFVAVKALLSVVSDLDQYLPEAFDGKDWMEHARKVYGCFVMMLNSVVLGAYDPMCLSMIGYKFGMMNERIIREESGAFISSPEDI